MDGGNSFEARVVLNHYSKSTEQVAARTLREPVRTTEALL